jgi:23S rRNA pseudouridine1911/1915/1917 synthase
MAKVKLVIDSRFNNKSILEVLNYYHLGKEKIKKVKFFLNGNSVDKNKVLMLKDVLELEYEDEIDFLPEDKKLNILYEDDNLLIVNKPINMLVHPDSKDKLGTLVNIVSNYYHKTNQNISVKYLHRIDMDTTGIVVFAKDILTASKLGVEIKEHTFTRRYLCIASGKFIEDSGIYNYPIAENRYIANKKRVSPTGKEAITHYKIIKRLRKNLNLCLVELKTGRTHQIRVHFSYKGHPLVGDALYNGNTNLLKRQALHSYEVDFIHPIKNERVYVKCELPLDMRKIVEEYK